jgi:PilZ domain
VDHCLKTVQTAKHVAGSPRLESAVYLTPAFDYVSVFALKFGYSGLTPHGAIMDARHGRQGRREERFPLTCVLQISWQRANGETCTTRATCSEVSLHGARVECSESLVARSSVYLSAPSYGLMGNATVRYCRRQGMKYAVGLEFTWAAALAEEGRKRVLPEKQ